MASTASEFIAIWRPGAPIAIAQPSPEQIGLDERRLARSHRTAAAPARPRASPKPNTCAACEAAAASSRRSKVLVVAIEDGDAALDQAGEDLRLGVGDGVERGEMFEMHRRDARDDRDMRARPCRPARRSRRRDSCRSRTRHSARSPACAPASAARPIDCCRRRPRHASRRSATARRAALSLVVSCRPSR